MNKICKQCGKAFETDQSATKYCSDACRQAALTEQRAAITQRQKEKRHEAKRALSRICKRCGKIFETDQSAAKYCSDACRKAARNAQNVISTRHWRAKNRKKFLAHMSEYNRNRRKLLSPEAIQRAKVVRLRNKFLAWRARKEKANGQTD